MDTETLTLTGNTVGTIVIAQPTAPEPEPIPNIYLDVNRRYYSAIGAIEVEVLAGTTPVYVTTDGSDPTVAGDDLVALAGVPGAKRRFPVSTSTSVTVKCISSGTPTVHVRTFGKAPTPAPV
jgi:hypothetical protein